MKDTAAQTLSLAIGAGTLVAILSARLRIPAVIPLLLTGIGLGREGLGVVDASALGPALGGLVAFIIGLLVYEGCLHLDRRSLAGASRAVTGLLTLGVLVTWAGVALLGVFVVGLPWTFASVLGAVLLVTGPTVVQPILRRVRVAPRVQTTLAAEAVLIDPIGVIATVATLEIVLAAHSGSGEQRASDIVRLYLAPWGVGAAVGLAVGLLAAVALRRLSSDRPGASEARSLYSISACAVAVGVGEALTHESGLVAATVVGMLLANASIKGMRELHRFNELIAGILVGALFVLLGSQIELDRLSALTWRDAAFVAGVLFIVRPVNVLVSTRRSDLSPRERAFVALFAPRGIVAASVATLVAARIAETSNDPAAAEWARRIEVLTLLVIFVSVAFAGALTHPLARLLGVLAGAPQGVLLVGGGRFARDFAAALRAAGATVRLLDANPSAVSVAIASGLDARLGDATNHERIEEDGLMNDIGRVVALTGNPDVDAVVTRWAAARVGAENVRALAPPPRSQIAPLVEVARPPRELLQAADAGAIRVVAFPASSPQALVTPFAWVAEGVARLGVPGKSTPATATLIGLGQPAPATTSPGAS